MEILRQKNFSFEENVISGNEHINKFYEVLKNPATKYFWDLDSILVNSPKRVFEKFNKENPYEITANVWEIDKLNYLTSLVENSGHIDHGDLEADWFKNIPLYRSKSYEYAKSALNVAINVSGVQNNFILTSRLPKLERATNLWIQREFSDFDKGNILIRKKGDLRGSVEYKVDMLKAYSGDNHHVVLIEDQERYIDASLKADIRNLLVIGIPLGVISYITRDDRLLVLSRYPVKEQETLPLLTLFQNAQNPHINP